MHRTIPRCIRAGGEGNRSIIVFPVFPAASGEGSLLILPDKIVFLLAYTVRATHNTYYKRCKPPPPYISHCQLLQSYSTLDTYMYLESPTLSFLMPDDRKSKYLHNTNDLTAARVRISIDGEIRIKNISFLIFFFLTLCFLPFRKEKPHTCELKANVDRTTAADARKTVTFLHSKPVGRPNPI